MIDTNLGWAAKQEYLGNAIGVFAGLTRPSSAVKVKYSSSGIHSINDFTQISTEPNKIVGAIQNSTIGYGFDIYVGAVGTGPTYSFYYAMRIPSGMSGWSWRQIASVTYDIQNDTYNRNPDSGPYQATISSSGSGWWTTYNSTYNLSYVQARTPSTIGSLLIPSYDTLDDFLADVASAISAGETPFAKTSEGYSVLCCVKRKPTLGGDVIFSPVLISTVSENTDYSRNAVPVASVTTHEKFGMTFYMRTGVADLADGAVISTNVPIIDYSSLPIVNASTLFLGVMSEAQVTPTGSPAPMPLDPYGLGGTSETGTGEGTFTVVTENIVRPAAPSFTFADTGFTRIFVPTLAQLKDLAEYLWTDGNFIQFIIDHGIKQFFENPADAIISLAYLPCTIPHTTDPVDVKLLFIDTGVDMYGATTQFVDVDCGSVFINEFYGSALDYNPYTKVSLFLPFIGVVELNADEVMNKNIYVKYRIDIVSGGCVAEVSAGDSSADNTCFYQFTGDCAINMPTNAADFSGYRAALIGAVETLTLVGAAAGAGVQAAHAESFYAEQASAAMAAGEVDSAGAFKDVGRIASARHRGAQASFKDSAHKAASNTIASVLSGKTAVQHGSGFTGNTGILGVRRPYVIINRPDMCNPGEYGTYNGRPAMIYALLGSLSGYTEVQNIQITGIAATNPELSEIVDFLHKGVIL